MFDWVQAAHQIGGAVAAWGAGYVRTLTGNYAAAFYAAGLICLAAATLVLLLGRDEAEPDVLRVRPADRSPYLSKLLSG